MNIPKPVREELVNELRFAAKKTSEEPDIRRKIFFYSAAYGVARRVLNSAYDPQILCAEFILEVSYNTINARSQAIYQGDTNIPFIEGFFDKLVGCLEELATRIENDEEIYKTLEKIIALTHTTTGNGYYLYVKGMAQI